MDSYHLILLSTAALLTVIILAGRWLRKKSMQLRNQVEMNTIYANFTHELLTPLTILSASVEKLRAAAPENHEEYDLMDLNIQRSVRLLQQMRENTTHQVEQQELRVVRSDIMQQLKGIALGFRPLMRSKAAEYTVVCEPESMMGWTDVEKIDRIVFNLLSITSQHLEDGCRLTFEASTNSYYDHTIIHISDNSRRSRTSLQSDDVLLSPTRSMVFRYGGSFYNNYTDNQGTTVVVELPISKEAFSDEQIDQSDQLAYNIPSRTILDIPGEHSEWHRETADDSASRILIVEDNEELLNLMKQLMQHRYQILTATNGREALEVVQANSIDLIISDVTMPEMNGYELTIRIKQDLRFAHLPVILITSKTQEEDRLEALSTGADDVINKPFKLKELTLRIDNIITNRQRLHTEADTTAEKNATTEEQMEDIGEIHISYDEEFVQRAIKCINDHITDSDYDRETFAADMGSSVSTLYNKLRALTGKSVTNFVRDIRIKEACRLAKEQPDLRVSDIAYRVGFKDPKYFATSFKRVMGIQPKEYFMQMRNEG